MAVVEGEFLPPPWSPLIVRMRSMRACCCSTHSRISSLHTASYRSDCSPLHGICIFASSFSGTVSDSALYLSLHAHAMPSDASDDLLTAANDVFNWVRGIDMVGPTRQLNRVPWEPR
jgi:hypothetical protein